MKALGFRVRSGFALAVLLDGSASSWTIVTSRTVPLSPTDGSFARFPFHPLIELRGASALAENQRAIAAVRRTASEEMSLLLEQVGPVDAAAIVTGSLIDSESISNPHIRAHALEGELFRTVICEALAEHEIAFQVYSDRDLLNKVAAIEGISVERMRGVLTEAGRSAFCPWTTHEKLATAGALWALSLGRRVSRPRQAVALGR